MKAVIPVAGAGTKLRPYTYTQPKPLIPVAGKPILAHIVENILRTPIRDFIFVVGYMAEKIKEYIEAEYKGRFNYRFVYQEPRLGTAHALWLCKELFGDEEILISFGDVIVDADVNDVAAAPHTTVAVHAVDDPHRFGVVSLGADGTVESLVEKSMIPKSNLAMVGLYKIKETDVFIESLDEVMNREKKDGEYHLTDVLALMREKGVKIYCRAVKNWFDCGDKERLLQANRTLLTRMPPKPLPVFPYVILIPPVHVGEGCSIDHAIVGPYVAVADHAHISRCIIQDSILGSYSRLETVILSGSIVGNDAVMIGKQRSVNVADNMSIDFGA
ncbi:MAG: sugar phosphate nucleotidyltransferase [Bacteroidia bacterium]|nr:sugar phosphate nucleotidyltransferase [Bacteroidia bacterium]MDW8332828.1 sugar phosphate nucleotidyltransferase [Bacteroidia bacterium]